MLIEPSYKRAYKIFGVVVVLIGCTASVAVFQKFVRTDIKNALMQYPEHWIVFMGLSFYFFPRHKLLTLFTHLSEIYEASKYIQLVTHALESYLTDLSYLNSDVHNDRFGNWIHKCERLIEFYFKYICDEWNTLLCYYWARKSCLSFYICVSVDSPVKSDVRFTNNASVVNCLWCSNRVIQ